MRASFRFALTSLTLFCAITCFDFSGTAANESSQKHLRDQIVAHNFGFLCEQPLEQLYSSLQTDDSLKPMFISAINSAPNSLIQPSYEQLTFLLMALTDRHDSLWWQAWWKARKSTTYKDESLPSQYETISPEEIKKHYAFLKFLTFNAIPPRSPFLEQNELLQLLASCDTCDRELLFTLSSHRDNIPRQALTASFRCGVMDSVLSLMLDSSYLDFQHLEEIGKLGHLTEGFRFSDAALKRRVMDWFGKCMRSDTAYVACEAVLSFPYVIGRDAYQVQADSVIVHPLLSRWLDSLYSSPLMTCKRRVDLLSQFFRLRANTLKPRDFSSPFRYFDYSQYNPGPQLESLLINTVPITVDSRFDADIPAFNEPYLIESNILSLGIFSLGTDSETNRNRLIVHIVADLGQDIVFLVDTGSGDSPRILSSLKFFSDGFRSRLSRCDIEGDQTDEFFLWTGYPGHTELRILAMSDSQIKDQTLSYFDTTVVVGGAIDFHGMINDSSVFSSLEVMKGFIRNPDSESLIYRYNPVVKKIVPTTKVTRQPFRKE